MGTGRKWEMLGKDSDESRSWELRARVEIPLVSRTGRERRRERAIALVTVPRRAVPASVNPKCKG